MKQNSDDSLNTKFKILRKTCDWYSLFKSPFLRTGIMNLKNLFFSARKVHFFVYKGLFQPGIFSINVASLTLVSRQGGMKVEPYKTLQHKNFPGGYFLCLSLVKLRDEHLKWFTLVLKHLLNLWMFCGWMRPKVTLCGLNEKH